ncbi:MAG: hypothetical protein LBH86_09995 [Oscillospiraceae bacterium]|nr:hypothetical protein [Oscillospiraceae bacterium]
MFRELYFYLRHNKMTAFLLTCQISLYLVLLGTFMAFTSEIHYGKSNLENIYENKAIYHLLDGYFDPDEFSNFRDRSDALEILKEYYHELDSASSFQYLAMFNQDISIDAKEVAVNSYSESTDDVEHINVRSFQMNLQAHDYFMLDVSEGRAFVSNDFEDKNGILPVLLGNSFADYYKVGDEISVSFYQQEITLSVVGILSENSLLYFNGDPEFYLDDYFILPYVNYAPPETEYEEERQEIIYFSMINGYISIPEGDGEFTRVMMAEVEAISQKTGFDNYLFIGSNPNTQPYRGLINVMNANYNLVKTIFILSFVINAIVISLILFFEQKKRLPAFAIHYLHGASISILAKRLISEVLLIMLLSYALSQIILSSVLNINSIVPQITLFFTVVVLAVVVSILPISNIVRKPLVVFLNNEEGSM